jgi:S-adenosylmethionine decarboxylase
VDLYSCQGDLDDETFLESLLEVAAVKAGSTVVNRLVHRFHPVGVSVFLILAETHISIQTWPEHGYAAVDIFVCGEGKDPSAAWDVIREGLGPESFEIKEIIRSIGERRA